MKKAAPLLFLLLSAVVFCAVYFLYSRPAESRPQTTLPVGARLTTEAFKAEHLKLLEVASAEGLKAAFETLRNDMDRDERVQNSCHELLHVFGRSVYGTYNDFGEAMRYQDEVCASGYIHGVLEGYLAAQPDIDAALAEVCGDLESATYKRSACFHGVGHALMFYSDNNLPLSLEKCDSFTNTVDRSDCYSGAYMENFNTDQKEHFSTFLDPARPLYPCTEYAKHLDACYMYAPLYYLGLHQDDYAGALTMCSFAPSIYRSHCYFGVGFQFERRNLKQPASVEPLCDTSEAWRASCIEGATYYHLSYHTSATTTRAMCAAFNAENARTCAAAVDTLVNAFKDF